METESLNILRSFSLGNALMADPQTDGQSLSSICEDAYKNANLVAKGWLGFRLMTTFQVRQSPSLTGCVRWSVGWLRIRSTIHTSYLIGLLGLVFWYLQAVFA